MMKFIKLAALFIAAVAAGLALAAITAPTLTVTGPDGVPFTVRLTNTPPPVGPSGSASGVLAMPPSTQFEVNGGALMKPRTGYDTLRIKTATIATGSSSGTAGEFRIACAASHMLFDDPIVYPGQRGKSHLHTFFGNSDVNGDTDTTLGNLSTFGRSTCDGGIANRSGYWVPAVINTVTGFPVTPVLNLAYYKVHWAYGGENPSPPFPVSSITVPVPGLRMIAGSAANTSGTGTGAYRWDCIHPDGTTTPGYSMPGTECLNGEEVLMLVFFPQCWDGVHLDSPNHQSHMAYSDAVTGCPSTHPVPIPAISFNVHYKVDANNRPENWRLASDTYALSTPAGRSAHGDWINGWDQTVLTGMVTHCLKAGKDCHADLLGDGTTLY
jgi:hypothetical protein